MTRLRLLAPLLAVLALGACGIPSDDSPMAIPADNLPPELLDPNPGSSTTLEPSTGTTTVPVYLLEEGSDGVRLIAVDREVAQASVPNQRLLALIPGPTAEETGQGLRSSIPTDTVLLDVSADPDGNEVVVDLSDDLLTIEGAALAQAFAQIVYTATEPGAGGFRAVRFLVDGESITVLNGDGAEEEGAVSRSDYAAFGPPRP